MKKLIFLFLALFSANPAFGMSTLDTNSTISQANRFLTNSGISTELNEPELKPDKFGSILDTSEFFPFIREVLIHTHCESARSSIAISKDSKFLATFSISNTVKIIDLITGELSYTINHNGPISSIAISNDSKFIITGSYDNTVKITDLTTGKLLRTIKHNGPILSIVISNDNKFIVTKSYGNTAKISDLTTGKLLHTIKHNDSISSIAISNDSKFITTGSFDKTAKITHLTTGKLLSTIKHNDSISSIAISNDSKFIITGSFDKTVKITDLTTGKLLRTIEHDNYVKFVEITNDSKFVLTGSYETVKITDLTTGKLLRTIKDKYHYISSIAINNDNKFFVVAGSSNTAKIIDLTTNELLLKIDHNDSVKFVAISNDSKFIVTGYSDKTLKITYLNLPDCIKNFNSSQLELISWLHKQAAKNNSKDLPKDLLPIELNDEYYEVFLTLNKQEQNALGKYYNLVSTSDKNKEISFAKLLNYTNLKRPNVKKIPKDCVYETQSKQHLKKNHCNLKELNLNKKMNDFFLEIYAQEKIEHNNGNYIFIHGREWVWNFYADIYKKLWNIIKKNCINSNYQFLRFGMPGPRRYDRDILFMNSAIFGNLTNFGSCSAHYCLNNYDQSGNKNLPNVLYEIFNNFNLNHILVKYRNDLEQLSTLHKKINDYGEMLLISIPNNKLHHVIFTASGGGVRQNRVNMQITKNTKTILDATKNNPEKVDILDRQEWGLILGKWEDGKYIPNPYANDPHNGPAIYSFHMGDEQKYEEYKKLRDEIFEKIKADIQNTQITSKL